MQSCEEIWQCALGELSRELSGASLKLWFCDLVLRFDGSCAILTAPSVFKRDLLEKSYSDLVARTLSRIVGYPVRVSFAVRSGAARDPVRDAALAAERDIGSADRERAAAVTRRDPLPSPAAGDPPPSVSPVTPADPSDRVQYMARREEVAELLSKNSGSGGYLRTVGGEREFTARENDQPSAPIPHGAAGGEASDSPFEYSFDSFIVGESNTFAYSFCKRVAEGRTEDYHPNPLFIYGPSGLGKTHLLCAMIRTLRGRDSRARVVYVKGDDFTNQLIDSIRSGTKEAFRDRYRRADVLLIDDIQFIAGKDSTQEEFFNTFNELYDQGKQIVLASDRPPRDIKLLENRLRTRFEWGVMADIQPPDLELRIAIMKYKAGRLGVTLPEDVLNYLGRELHSNVRQLEGAVKKLAAMTRLAGREITVDLAVTCAADLITSGEPTRVTVARILDAVSAAYGFTAEQLRGRGRTKELAAARNAAVYAIRRLTDLSLPAIGRELGGRDHSTIISSLDRVEKDIASLPQYARSMDALLNRIREC